MVLQMWNFIKFLGMVIIILFLFVIIFSLIDVIYNNIKIEILKKKLIKEINKNIENGTLEIGNIIPNQKDDK